MTMLYGGRKKERERREAEARGENLWIRDFPAEVRTKIALALQDSASNPLRIMEFAHASLARELGRMQLAATVFKSPAADFGNFCVTSATDDFASCVEAIYRGLVHLERQENGMGYSGAISSYDSRAFRNRVQEICATDRVAWDFVAGEMVPFSSREMHVEVVAPTLSLLAGDARFTAVEVAYQDALRELAADKADNAITDAGRALQEFLSALGCEGESLGPLLASARKRHLFGPYDYRLADVIGQAIDWVSADRSQMGDAHKAGAQIRDDAWLTVHVVGALILRLAKGPRS